MRLALTAALLCAAAPVLAEAPPAAMEPASQWHRKALEIYTHAIAVPTVQGRGKTLEMATYLQEQLQAGGFTDIKIQQHDVVRPDDKAAALILRWPATRPSGRKAILLMAHMDVVDALRADWSREPFELGREGGYFYGRGTSDDKQGVVAITAALLQLRAEGFKPDRDIIVLFTGDEETGGDGADRAANEWLDVSTIDYALNADAGGGAWLEDGTSVGFGIQTAEKVYQDFTFTATNPGGHSSRPRPDNAIYALAHTLERLEKYRFEPMLNDTTRAMFTDRLRTAEPPLAAAIRRWLANPKDGEAADLIEATPTEVGLTRTRCVATRLEGGHANNALPQLARATVNCRMFPGHDPAQVLTILRGIAEGDKVAVEPVDQARPADASPLREDVVGAYTAEIHARYPGVAIVPNMSTGATDGLYFRNRGVPVYGVESSWGITPIDERAHGRDERNPERSFYNNIDHWVGMVSRLAGPEGKAGRRSRR
jgi:acetylornithine deacetylase/succinyl-diaminopimelate desuccinylase-like protein